MTGAANMGLDDALMDRARRTGECVLRIYSWSRPTLSFGRHQLVRDRIDLGCIAAAGIDVVRRPTGGRALLHHREVTYSVTAPVSHTRSVRDWYDWINGVLLDALQSLGVPAAPAIVTGRTPAPGTASCFKRPDAGEITADGRKLVGSALLRERGALLQHGSILLDDDQQILARLLPDGEAGGPPPASIRDILGDAVTAEMVGDAVVGALRGAVPVVESLTLDADTSATAATAAARYGGEAWLIGR